MARLMKERSSGSRIPTRYTKIYIGGVCLIMALASASTLKGANQSSIEGSDPNDLESTLRRVKIIGEIVIAGEPIAGVLIETNNGGTSDLTNSQGRFMVEVPYGWSGEIRPSKKGWEFNPATKEYTNITQNIDECGLGTCEERLLELPAPRGNDPCDWWFPDTPKETAAPGRFGISPMVLSVTGKPGTEVTTPLKFQCLGSIPALLEVSLQDLSQTSQGGLQLVESKRSAQGSGRSCREWIQLKTKQPTHIATSPMESLELPIVVRIPEHADGGYLAAVVVDLVNPSASGVAIRHQFVVPLLVGVIGPTRGHCIELLDLEMVVEEAEDTIPNAFVRLWIENQGVTLPYVNGTTDIQIQDEYGRWQPHFRLGFDTVRILPGMRLCLESDIFDIWPQDVISVTGGLRVFGEEQFFRKTISVASTKGEQTGAGPLECRNHAFPVQGRGQTPTDMAETFMIVDFGHRFYVDQYIGCPDPYHTYSGGLRMTTTSNLEIGLDATVCAQSAARGSWITRVHRPATSGTTELDVHVCGTDVMIEQLVGGAKNITVAEVTIRQTPNTFKLMPSDNVFEDFTALLGHMH